MVQFQRYWDLNIAPGVNYFIVHIFSGQNPTFHINNAENRNVSCFLLSEKLH